MSIRKEGFSVDRDIMMETSGLSRREMLIGAGVLAAGYGVGQLATASPAYAADAGEFIPGTTGLAWPTWTEAELEDAAQLAAIRGANQFRSGGG